jgi:hypothetical protein
MRRFIILALSLLAIGLPTATIITRLESDGATNAQANAAVAHARSGAARLADVGQPDIFKHRLALFSSTAGAGQGRLRVRDALCGDLADAGPGFTADVASCRVREADALTVPICNASEQARGSYGEGTFRDRERDRLVAAEDLGPPNIVLDVGTPAEVQAAMTALGFRRCADP